jgi:hypothetical protein
MLFGLEMTFVQQAHAGDIVNAFDMAAGLIHGADKCKIELSDAALRAFLVAASKHYGLDTDEQSELSGMISHDPDALRPIGKYYFTRMKWTCNDVSKASKSE